MGVPQGQGLPPSTGKNLQQWEGLSQQVGVSPSPEAGSLGVWGREVKGEPLSCGEKDCSDPSAQRYSNLRENFLSVMIVF